MQARSPSGDSRGGLPWHRGPLAAPAAHLRAATLSLHRAALGVADRIDRDVPRAARAMTAGWGLARLAAVAASIPVTSPLTAIAGTGANRRARRSVAALPGDLDAAVLGRPVRHLPVVERASAGERWFLTSDLHRGVPGRADWPAVAGTKALYAAALDHYAADGWGLVENGDVDEFWMVGGSAYGVAYDVGRTLAAALAVVDDALLGAVYREHLDRIVANNAAIVSRVRDDFAAAGRYVRLVGNHDDCVARPPVAARLRAHVPGIRLADLLVLEHRGKAVGLALHGHQVDGWNDATGRRLGLFTTWLASAIQDVPWGDAHPGLPVPRARRALLHGRTRDVLTALPPVFGVTADLESLDEVALARAARAHWGDDGPRLLLGHTHFPRHDPAHPAGGSWPGYTNSGNAITPGLCTGIEWDGRSDPSDPSVRLVVWHWADADPDTPAAAVVAHVDGRPVARQVLARDPASDCFVVVP